MTAPMKTLIEDLEKQRLKKRHTYKVLMLVGWPLLVVGFLLAILGTVLKWKYWDNVFGILFVVMGVAGVVVLIVAATVSASFKKKARQMLQDEVDAEFFPKAIYEPNHGLPLNIFMTPGFFAAPDRYLNDGYMQSSYQGIPFEKANYNLQKREEHHDSKGNTTVTYDTYAKGSIYRFAFGRQFGAIVKVLEKNGFLTTSNGLSKVETEYIEFNKKFVVLTSDQTLVFYLLTPQIQEKIMSLEGKFKGQFYMAFVGNELFIAVNDSGTTIEIPWSKPMTEETMQPILECMAIPAVFITLLGLTKAKFEKNAGTDVPAAS
jgi:hypothetical protein